MAWWQAVVKLRDEGAMGTRGAWIREPGHVSESLYEGPFEARRPFALHFQELLVKWYRAKPMAGMTFLGVEIRQVPPPEVPLVTEPGEVPPLMECGHVAQGRSGEGWACVICLGLSPGASTPTAVTTHAYRERLAQCVYCKRPAVSHPTRLSFFSFAQKASPDEEALVETAGKELYGWREANKIRRWFAEDIVRYNNRDHPGQPDHYNLEMWGHLGGTGSPREWLAKYNEEDERRRLETVAVTERVAAKRRIDPFGTDSYYCGCHGWS